MKGLSSLERVVLECVGNKTLAYQEVQRQSGLHENVCFNILQALIIRGILCMDRGSYKVSDSLSPLTLEEINGQEAKEAESLELMEAVVGQKNNRVFRLKKIAMDERDEKIFLAMLSNLDSFLNDAHKKAQTYTSHKDRKIIFWGMGDIHTVMNQIVRG